MACYTHKVQCFSFLYFIHVCKRASNLTRMLLFISFLIKFIKPTNTASVVIIYWWYWIRSNCVKMRKPQKYLPKFNFLYQKSGKYWLGIQAWFMEWDVNELSRLKRNTEYKAIFVYLISSFFIGYWNFWLCMNVKLMCRCHEFLHSIVCIEWHDLYPLFFQVLICIFA
jgi:hypothetical protein